MTAAKRSAAKPRKAASQKKTSSTKAKPRAPKTSKLTKAGAPRKRAARQGEGRPRKFRPEYIEQARKLVERGATVMEIADFFGVNPATIWHWSQREPEFFNALRIDDAAATDRVKRSLFERAVGYTTISEKITVDAKTGRVTRTPFREHVPPDVSAASLWLRNKDPGNWRDRSEQHVTGGIVVKIDAADEKV